MSDGEEMARLEPSTFRLYLAVMAAALLAALLIFFALGSGSGGSRFVLATGAVLSGLAAYTLWNRGRGALVLTTEGLIDETGAVIARMEEIASVDRGAFAFKPSNGFGLKLTVSRRFEWRPGLWWSYGTRIGVGGLTGAAAGKFLADRLALELAERDGTGPFA